jgi:glucokinase
MPYAIGIDLGGTNIKAVIVSAEAETFDKSDSAFDPVVLMDWGQKIRALVQKVQKERGEAAAIGVSAPGLAARDGTAIVRMPQRLQGLEGLNWQHYLGAARPVPVLNDAHAALLGEAWLGAARGFADVFMLTLGTGVGGAALVDGRLLCGHIGRGGHLGHVCLNPDAPPGITGMPGSLEDTIGNCTLWARTSGRFHFTRDLVEAHKAGDRDASRVWLESVRRLACAVASFINVLDPEAAIVGGGIARAGAALFEPLQHWVRQYEWSPTGSHVKILPAELGEFAGAYGAAHNALMRTIQ